MHLNSTLIAYFASKGFLHLQTALNGLKQGVLRKYRIKVVLVAIEKDAN